MPLDADFKLDARAQELADESRIKRLHSNREGKIVGKFLYLIKTKKTPFRVFLMSY